MTARMRGARTLPTSFVAIVLAFGSGLAAQTIAEGLQHQVAALPSTAGAVHVLAPGDFVYFDGQSLMRQMPGASPKQLLRLPAPAWWSFTIATDQNHVLFGENSTGALWLVPLSGPAPSAPLCNLPFNYDAVVLSPGTALVTGRIGGFGGSTQIFLVDLTTGSKWILAQLPGPSGPIALAANGDLHYATASALFPTPPGATSILRFPKATIDQAITDRRRLVLADATVVWSGLDAASDLCFDDDDDLLFVDWMNNTIGELNDATGPSPWLGAPLVAYGTLPGAATLQFVASSGPAVFEPFQPAQGVLHVHETDYFSTSAVRSLQATRPGLQVQGASPLPQGVFVLQADNGPANALCFAAIALTAAPSGVPIQVAGFEQPLLWHLAATSTAWFPFTLDAQGSGLVGVVNPGFTPAVQATVQTAMVSTTGVLASTAAVVFQLGT